MILRFIPRRFMGKKFGYSIGAWNVRTVLKRGALKSLVTQLVNCKVSSHTGDWIDRCRFNMGY